MEQPIEAANWILLAGASDVDQECWADRFQQLPRHEHKYPKIGPFIGARLHRASKLEAAQREVEQRGGCLPVLAIVDARLMSESGRSKSGEAAVELLDWLTQHGSVPAFVVTENPPEDVLPCVLERPDRLLWSNRIGQARDGGVALAIALSSLASPRRHRRLIIGVAERSTSYRIQFGQHPYSPQERPCTQRTGITGLIDRVEKFQPYQNNQKVDRWLDAVSVLGIDAFRTMVSDTLAPPITKLIQSARDNSSTSPTGGLPSWDLRFEFNLKEPAGEALFNLPFELSCNADFAAADRRFLCQSIPMARRVHLGDPDPGRDAEQDEAHPGSPLRLLFIGANVSGHIVIRPEDGGQDLPALSLDPLESVATELKYLQALAKRLDGRLTVEKLPRKKGLRLQDHIEQQVTGGRYDIIHFSGHSTSIGDSTFLVLPGEDAQAGHPLSMRLVGSWMKQGNCKLLVLSSCSGGSARTALEVMSAGALGVLAFRWQVDDKFCARFMQRFYTAYFDASNTQGIPEAYRRACAGTHDEARGTPTWASALAVVRD